MGTCLTFKLDTSLNNARPAPKVFGEKMGAGSAFGVSFPSGNPSLESSHLLGLR